MREIHVLSAKNTRPYREKSPPRPLGTRSCSTSGRRSRLGANGFRRRRALQDVEKRVGPPTQDRISRIFSTVNRRRKPHFPGAPTWLSAACALHLGEQNFQIRIRYPLRAQRFDGFLKVVSATAELACSSGYVPSLLGKRHVSGVLGLIGSNHKSESVGPNILDIHADPLRTIDRRPHFPFPKRQKPFRADAGGQIIEDSGAGRARAGFEGEPEAGARGCPARMDRPDAKRPSIVTQNGDPPRRSLETRVPHQRTVGENTNSSGIGRARQGLAQRTTPHPAGERRNGTRGWRTNRHQCHPTDFDISAVENLQFKCILLTILMTGSAANWRQRHDGTTRHCPGPP